MSIICNWQANESLWKYYLDLVRREFSISIHLPGIFCGGLFRSEAVTISYTLSTSIQHCSTRGSRGSCLLGGCPPPPSRHPCHSPILPSLASPSPYKPPITVQPALPLSRKPSLKSRPLVSTFSALSHPMRQTFVLPLS